MKLRCFPFLQNTTSKDLTSRLDWLIVFLGCDFRGDSASKRAAAASPARASSPSWPDTARRSSRSSPSSVCQRRRRASTECPYLTCLRWSHRSTGSPWFRSTKRETTETQPMALSVNTTQPAPSPLRTAWGTWAWADPVSPPAGRRWGRKGRMRRSAVTPWRPETPRRTASITTWGEPRCLWYRKTRPMTSVPLQVMTVSPRTPSPLKLINVALSSPQTHPRRRIVSSEGTTPRQWMTRGRWRMACAPPPPTPPAARRPPAVSKKGWLRSFPRTWLGSSLLLPPERAAPPSFSRPFSAVMDCHDVTQWVLPPHASQDHRCLAVLLLFIEMFLEGFYFGKKNCCSRENVWYYYVVLCQSIEGGEGRENVVRMSSNDFFFVHQNSRESLLCTHRFNLLTICFLFSINVFALLHTFSIVCFYMRKFPRWETSEKQT